MLIWIVAHEFRRERCEYITQMFVRRFITYVERLMFRADPAAKADLSNHAADARLLQRQSHHLRRSGSKRQITWLMENIPNHIPLCQ